MDTRHSLSAPSGSAPSGRLIGLAGASLLVLAALLGPVTPAGAAGDQPQMSPEAKRVGHDNRGFGSDPKYGPATYDPKQQVEIYGGKKPIDEPRPLVELGQKLYVEGPLDKSYDWFGRKNLAQPAFSIFGDWRTAFAYNDGGRGKELGQIATRLNLETDLWLTSTERFHALFRPLDRGGVFTHAELFGPDRGTSQIKIDAHPRTLFFEGDLGNIIAGATNKYQSYDLPFSVGLVPLIFQNGVWFNSAISGGAFSLIGKHSREFDISNMEFTFFGGFDKVFDRQVYGIAGFFEATEGYWEAGVGGVNDDRQFGTSSYQSLTVAFTKRYGGWLSNSVRGVWTIGNSPQFTQTKTKDGFILLVENSLVSHQPLVLVPYFNFFAGFGRPQSLLRNADAGGILFNTGILFETDGLTGYPKLDDTGQDTYGGAVGIEYLFNLEQQIVVEAATVQVHGDDVGRPAKGSQYGVGARYQRNLTRATLFRADAMYGWRDNDVNIAGIRTEFRWKF
jgi:hypothetical protein